MRTRRRDARSTVCSDHPGSVWIFCFPCHLCRVLDRAHVDGPGSPPNTKDKHVAQAVLSRPYLGLVPTAYVGHRQETGLSPLARTCS